MVDENEMTETHHSRSTQNMNLMNSEPNQENPLEKIFGPPLNEKSSFAFEEPEISDVLENVFNFPKKKNGIRFKRSSAHM